MARDNVVRRAWRDYRRDAQRDGLSKGQRTTWLSARVYRALMKNGIYCFDTRTGRRVVDRERVREMVENGQIWNLYGIGEAAVREIRAWLAVTDRNAELT